MNRYTIKIKMISLLSVLALLGGCAQTAFVAGSVAATADTADGAEDMTADETAAGTTADTSETSLTVETAAALDGSTMFTDRDLEADDSPDVSSTVTLTGETAGSSDSSVRVDGSTVTITAAGSYIVSGSLEGQLIVDADENDDVQLVLDHAQITSTSSAAVYVKQADNVVITLADGSSNSLSNTGSYAAIDDNNIDGAVFSKADLTFNGSGQLTVAAAYGSGIVGKDELAVTGGTYIINAAEHGMAGKDNIKIADGGFTVEAGKDAFHSENKDDDALGFIYIGGGSYNLTAQGDGFDAATVLQVEKGSFTVNTGGGRNGVLEEASAKGFKAGSLLLMTDGSFALNCADDALHCNGDLTVSGGDFTISTGDDGLHADNTALISGGSLEIEECYEGVEGLNVTVSGGKVSVVSSDDGINAAGGNDSSGFGTRAGKDTFGAGSDAAVNISGGEVTVDAKGDGIDSNGSFVMTGGTVYVTGPQSNDNSALDYDGSGSISGGVLVAAGAAGMTQTVTAQGQGVIAVSLESSQSGAVSLSDVSAETLAAYIPSHTYSWVLVSAPGITDSGTYTLKAGEETQSIEMTSLQYGTSAAGGMGGGRGSRGGGSRPAGEPPSDTMGAAEPAVPDTSDQTAP